LAGKDHVLLNRDLFDEFAARLTAAKWDVALLQEVPPRWDERLARAAGSAHLRGMTSRNWMSPVMSPVARFRPHLPGSWEGGSNLILSRKGKPGQLMTQSYNRTLCWLPERRVLSMARFEDGFFAANLHASTGPRAGKDVLRAAEIATGWAGDAPLLLGGDFNLRPRSSGVFAELHERFGFTLPSNPDGIDHLLVRGCHVVEPTEAWAPERRDVPDPESGLSIRLSDHSPVVARIDS